MRAQALIATTTNTVTAIPPTKPTASGKCGARRATQISTAAAKGRTNNPIVNPVMRLKLIRNPPATQTSPHRGPRPPTSWRCRHINAAAIATRRGQARIKSDGSLLRSFCSDHRSIRVSSGTLAHASSPASGPNAVPGKHRQDEGWRVRDVRAAGRLKDSITVWECKRCGKQTWR